MIEPGSSAAVLIGRWGAASSLVVGAVLVGCAIRDMPYLLPNRLPGLVLYELGPGLLLAVAIWFAVHVTRANFRASTRLILLVLLATFTGTLIMVGTFASSLGGRWI